MQVAALQASSLQSRREVQGPSSPWGPAFSTASSNAWNLLHASLLTFH